MTDQFQQRLDRDPDAARLLAAIVASSDDAIISKSIEGVVTSWNAAAERIFGYTADEMIGQSISLLGAPGHEDEMPTILRRLRQGERIDHFETVRRRKDGGLVHVSLSVSPIHDADGKVIGASKVARDISSQRDAALALTDAERRVAEQQKVLLHAARLIDLGEMAGSMAHELNQPLGAISNYLNGCLLSLSQMEPGVVAEIEEAIFKAKQQANRASDFVRRMRSFARRNEGKPSPEALHSIIEDTIALVAADARLSEVKVVVQEDQRGILVMVDRSEILQVLLNLARNAIEAMQDSERKELRLSTRAGPKLVEVSVSDTGPGLNDNVRSRLFEPFVTTKESGMGMGLSICRNIIESHGGRIEADDFAGNGTTFRFTLAMT
jgi:two-component system sensor kinase FixL